MLDKDDLRRLLDYTVWANHRQVRAAATLTNDEFRRDLGSSHGGVRGTLVHMMWAELLWLERWKGLPNPPRIDEGEFPDVMGVRERWGVVESHREAWLGALTAGDADVVVHYKTTEGKAFAAPLWQLVQHAVNHATYHRGQVTAFMRLLGAKPVSTDLLIWDRDRR